MTLLPPPVCTGTGTIATDLQGMIGYSSFPMDGTCGICGARIRVDGYMRLVTHPYSQPEPPTVTVTPPPRIHYTNDE